MFEYNILSLVTNCIRRLQYTRDCCALYLLCSRSSKVLFITVHTVLMSPSNVRRDARVWVKCHSKGTRSYCSVSECIRNKFYVDGLRGVWIWFFFFLEARLDWLRVMACANLSYWSVKLSMQSRRWCATKAYLFLCESFCSSVMKTVQGCSKVRCL